MATRKQLEASTTRAAELLRRPAQDPRVQALAETLYERDKAKGDTARAQLTAAIARQVTEHAVLEEEEEAEVSLEQAAADMAAEILAMPDEFLPVIRRALSERESRGLRVVK